ncbi:MAG TPA: SDR family oxidoreductase [Chitinophagales bacterium]|nr:SDR family oxidoreductase [Chitinophagales bacterium]
MEKRALLTGANSGIGKETVAALLEQGYELIMICRDKEKGEAVMNEFKLKFPSSKIHLFLCDLASVNAVKNVSGEIKSSFNSLDVLVNNAGAIFKNRETTIDGLEKTFATNHLSYFHLTNELLPLLLTAPAARIVNVASQASKFSRLNFDDLQLERKFNGGIAYGNSKLMNLLFTYALAKKMEGSSVTVNAVHPGGVRTQFYNSLGAPAKIYRLLFGWSMRSPKKGAETVIWLASSPEVAGVNGKYFQDRKPLKSILISYDEGAQKKLWEVSEGMILAKLK